MSTVENNYEDKDYEPAGLWKGMQRWQCKICPYASVVEEEAIRHVARHAAAQPRRSLEVPLYDSRGNLITER
jgi:hypothetical protein